LELFGKITLKKFEANFVFSSRHKRTQRICPMIDSLELFVNFSSNGLKESPNVDETLRANTKVADVTND